jgi:hypothetical protein
MQRARWLRLRPRRGPVPGFITVSITTRTDTTRGFTRRRRHAGPRDSARTTKSDTRQTRPDRFTTRSPLRHVRALRQIRSLPLADWRKDARFWRACRTLSSVTPVMLHANRLDRFEPRFVAVARRLCAWKKSATSIHRPGDEAPTCSLAYYPIGISSRRAGQGTERRTDSR